MKKNFKMLSLLSLLSVLSLSVTGCSVSQSKINARTSNAVESSIVKENGDYKEFTLNYKYSYLTTNTAETDKNTTQEVNYDSTTAEGREGLDAIDFKNIYDTYKSVPRNGCYSNLKEEHKDWIIQLPGYVAAYFNVPVCEAEKKVFSKNVTFTISYNKNSANSTTIKIILDKEDKMKYLEIVDTTIDNMSMSNGKDHDMVTITSVYDIEYK